MPDFNYERAFSRNIGWITQAEQSQLKNKRVAIAGMGGAGGNYLITLIRLGVTRFRIADFDNFDLVNFNRQVGATLSALNRPKVEVMLALAKDINPEVDIEVFGAVSKENLPAFLGGVDVYLDGLDFFAFEARADTFAACREMQVPAVTAAPLGMSAAVLSFMPGEMSFEEYFGWGQRPELEKAISFLVGLSPRGLHRSYLVDPGSVDLAERRGPSTFMACQLCAGMAATEALKILLKRGKVWAAPYAFQFDAYHNKLVRTWRPGGYKHPLQRLSNFLITHKLAKLSASKKK